MTLCDAVWGALSSNRHWENCNWSTGQSSDGKYMERKKKNGRLSEMEKWRNRGKNRTDRRGADTSERHGWWQPTEAVQGKQHENEAATGAGSACHWRNRTETALKRHWNNPHPPSSPTFTRWPPPTPRPPISNTLFIDNSLHYRLLIHSRLDLPQKGYCSIHSFLSLFLAFFLAFFLFVFFFLLLLSWFNGQGWLPLWGS